MSNFSEIALSASLTDTVNEKMNKRLTKKIDKINALRKQIAEVKSNINHVTSLFNQIVAPIQKDSLEAREQCLLKLRALSKRKSLPKKYVHLIEDMMQEMLLYLLEVGHTSAAFQKVTKEYQENMSRAMDNGEMSAAREELKGKLKSDLIGLEQMTGSFDHKEFEKYFERVEKLSINELMEEVKRKKDEHFHQLNEQEKLDAIKEKRQFDDDYFQKLYKRLSKKIHPDLVQDAKEKKRREEQMKELSEAWSKRDYTHLLSLNESLADSEELVLEEKELKLVLKQLNRTIAELEHEKSELKRGESRESQLYQSFYSKSEQKIQERMKFSAEELEKDCDHFRELNAIHLKSVRAAKEYLDDITWEEDTSPEEVFFGAY